MNIFVNQLKQVIEELIHVHERLFDLSKEKTDIIKSKKIDELPSLLMEENKLLKLLEKTEEKRLQIVTPFFEEENIIPENRTVTRLLECLDREKDRNLLEHEFATLTNTIINLKHQEQLNNQLIQQSLQLIQLSLGMINPTIQNMNYGKEKESQDVSNRSVFDSRA